MNPPNPSSVGNRGTRHELGRGETQRATNRLTESLRKEGAGKTPRIGSQGTHPAPGSPNTNGGTMGTMETFLKCAINMQSCHKSVHKWLKWLTSDV